ncbi:MAG: hypothetical protein ABMB14_15780 [Myxococcota bacterium]
MLIVMSAFAQPAQAVVFLGNPELTFRVDRAAHDYTGGAVTLTKVRVGFCSGSTTDVTVGAVIDPVEAVVVAIPAGDLCGIQWFWGSDLDVDGPGYTVRYSAATTAVVLDPDGTLPPKALSPYSVVSGSMGGGGPWLLASID